MKGINFKVYFTMHGNYSVGTIRIWIFFVFICGSRKQNDCKLNSHQPNDHKVSARAEFIVIQIYDLPFTYKILNCLPLSIRVLVANTFARIASESIRIIDNAEMMRKWAIRNYFFVCRAFSERHLMFKNNREGCWFDNNYRASRINRFSVIGISCHIDQREKPLIMTEDDAKNYFCVFWTFGGYK